MYSRVSNCGTDLITVPVDIFQKINKRTDPKWNLITVPVEIFVTNNRYQIAKSISIRQRLTKKFICHLIFRK